MRHYARVYYDDLQAEYPQVYSDDALLATWLRMLVAAERTWPIAAEVPRSVRPRALARLVELELVEPMPSHCYRIRGLDKERSRRADAARNAAAQRWHSGRNADRNAETMPRRDETRRDENLPPPPAERGRRKNGTNPRASGAAPRQTGSSPRQNGSSPRQEREALKTGPTRLGDILARAAEAGRPEKVPA